MKNKERKICFAASSGGHLEQLMLLRPLYEKYDSYLVTERQNYQCAVRGLPVFYVLPINRTDRFFGLKLICNTVKSLMIVIKNRPDAVISTGALAAVPVIFWAKLLGARVIYIESFSKVNSPTLSGRLVYRLADQFYVQWEEMKKIYPGAICRGGIY